MNRSQLQIHDLWSNQAQVINELRCLGKALNYDLGFFPSVLLEKLFFKWKFSVMSYDPEAGVASNRARSNFIDSESASQRRCEILNAEFYLRCESLGISNFSVPRTRDESWFDQILPCQVLQNQIVERKLERILKKWWVIKANHEIQWNLTFVILIVVFSSNLNPESLELFARILRRIKRIEKLIFLNLKSSLFFISTQKFHY